MAKHMWSNALGAKRRTSLAGEGDVLVEQVFDTIRAESTAVGCGEQCFGTVSARLRQPGFQHSCGCFRQWSASLLTQAVSDQKRVANSKVVEMVLTGVKAARGKRRSANGSVTGADCDLASFPHTASSD